MSGADPLIDFVVGQPFRPRAPQLNAWNDAARIARQFGANIGPPPPSHGERREGNIVTVRNDSGATRQRFDVLAIDGPVFDPAESDTHAGTFQSRVVFQGKTPGSADYGRFVVLLEPANDGALARAQISGVCPAVIKAAGQVTRWADIDEGEHRLKATDNGHAEILWEAGGVDEGEEMFALLRLGRRDEPKIYGELLEDLHYRQSATVDVWGFDASHALTSTGRVETVYDGLLLPGFYLPAGRFVTAYHHAAEAPHWMLDNADDCALPVEES